jgi:membrane protease YdiL (CAAX protease family)
MSTRPFRPWLTVAGTVIVAALLVAGLLAKRHATIDIRAVDPLAAFDTRIQRERVDQRLPDAVAADAERTLRAVLADPSISLAVTRGARARLAVVLGERGHWSDAQPLVAPGDHGTVFPRVVACAYGPDPQACERVGTCDASRAAALAAYAGTWCAARACIVAAGRGGDTAAAQRLARLPAPFPLLHSLRIGVDEALMMIGLVAAWMVRRRPDPASASDRDLPTPWSLGQLYAALLRCALWSLLTLTLFLVGIATFTSERGNSSAGTILYAAGLWWTARLVFRRWGLSWRDSLGWPAERAVGLTMLAAIGLQRAGQRCLGLLASAFHQHAGWGDLPALIDARAGWRLLLMLLEMVVLAPLVEELVFRRTILARLARTRSPAFAIVTSTILFTLPHGYSPVGLVSIFWSGLVFAWAFHRTGNLWPGVVAHAYGNGMALWWNLM